jgi:hypothetical protein
MLLALCAVALAACGGGDKQDANEPSATYRVAIVKAKFPGRQYLGARQTLTLVIRNIGSDTIPNLTTSISNSSTPGPSGFYKRLDDPNLADPNRPIWVLDRSPNNSITAYTSTWAVGPLEPHRTKILTWHVSAVMPGNYSVHYLISGGLNGKAKAVQADGSPAKGSLRVFITPRPHPVENPIE